MAPIAADKEAKIERDEVCNQYMKKRFIVIHFMLLLLLLLFVCCCFANMYMIDIVVGSVGESNTIAVEGQRFVGGARSSPQKIVGLCSCQDCW
jgi:hypothetical protein